MLCKPDGYWSAGHLFLIVHFIVYFLLFQSAVWRIISQLTSQIANMVQAKLNTLPHTKGTIMPAEIVENSICAKACPDAAVPRILG